MLYPLSYGCLPTIVAVLPVGQPDRAARAPAAGARERRRGAA